MATLIAVPYLEILRRISSRFVIMLCIYIAVVVFGFWIYGMFLTTLGDLIRSGNIKYVFEFKSKGGKVWM